MLRYVRLYQERKSWTGASPLGAMNLFQCPLESFWKVSYISNGLVRIFLGTFNKLLISVSGSGVGLMDSGLFLVRI